VKLQSIVREIARLSARRAVLASGRQLELQLATTTKLSREPLSHDELSQMLIDAAPRGAQIDLRAGRPPSPFTFDHEGSSFTVVIDGGRDRWSVTVTPRSVDEDTNIVDFSSFAIEAGDEEDEDEAPVRPFAVEPSRGGVVEPPWPSEPVLPIVEPSRSVSSGSPQSAESMRGISDPARNGSSELVRNGAGDPARNGSSELVRNGAGDTARSPATDVIRAAVVDPFRSLVAEPIRGAVAEPIRGAVVDPIRGAMAEPVRAAVAEPARGQAPEPPWGSDPVATRPAVPQATPPRPMTPAGEPEINAILKKLLCDDGSDAHLTAGQVPRYRIDGNIQAIPGFALLTEEVLRRMLYEIMPARVRSEYEATNDGDFAYAIEGLSRFRVNVAVDRHGSYAVIRRIPFQIMSPEQIGLPKKVLDLCWLTKGLVLVTGPTGSGKSTTLATLIDFINTNRQDHIITIEDPVEFVHPDTKKCLIRQREVGEHTGSFKRALKAALREDPDIVLVGELRDLETIAIAIETAETGHLVFGTLHTTTAASTVDRIIDQFPSDRQDQIRVMLSESLKGVISQTLCKRINGGRVAAYEVLLGTKAISNLIREGKTFQIHSVLQTSKSAGMMTMGESLFQLVKNRTISPEEAWMRAVDKEELRNMFEKAGIKVKMQSLIDDL
jgi:twitching motility protein PilT